LTDRLPKSNYEGESEVVSKKPMHTSKQKTSASTNISLRGINLPALDRIVIKNNNNKLPSIGGIDSRKHNPDHRSLEAMLRIDGRGRNGPEIEREDRRGADIKAELRKIYNLRPSPKKSAVRRRVELPRLH
jgi:hypothetical protein